LISIDFLGWAGKFWPHQISNNFTENTLRNFPTHPTKQIKYNFTEIKLFGARRETTKA
jgi:hypothetical protein